MEVDYGPRPQGKHLRMVLKNVGATAGHYVVEGSSPGNWDRIRVVIQYDMSAEELPKELILTIPE